MTYDPVDEVEEGVSAPERKLPLITRLGQFILLPSITFANAVLERIHHSPEACRQLITMMMLAMW